MLLQYLLRSFVDRQSLKFGRMDFSFSHVKEVYTINPLALELDISIVAHHLCKMWVLYDPKKVTLWNTRHSVEEQIEIV